eukprot:SAG31_NODE_1144_length_9687_cov_10.800167_3_plen_75_part_00
MQCRALNTKIHAQGVIFSPDMGICAQVWLRIVGTRVLDDAQASLHFDRGNLCEKNERCTTELAHGAGAWGHRGD